MPVRGYGQFCPVALATEVLAERWTLLVIRELLCGSTRFNDLHRGVPLMSASLLSQRLRDLEFTGLVERQPLPTGKGFSYHLTESGQALRPTIDAIGLWGLRYMRKQFAPENLDPKLLMWDIRRGIVPWRMPPGRMVVRFDFLDTSTGAQHFWLIKTDTEHDVDVCVFEPGFPVDLTITSTLENLTRVWMGDIDPATATRNGSIQLEGSSDMRASFCDWIGLSRFARLVAAPDDA